MGQDRFAIARLSYWCCRNIVVVPTDISACFSLDVSNLLSISVGRLNVDVNKDMYAVFVVGM